MRTCGRYFLLAVLGVVLVAVICIQILPAGSTGGRKFAWRSHVPETIDGWRSVDLPLGNTELMSAAVAVHLNFDDCFYRVYEKNGQRVFLYAMLWSQGKISVREMAGHTPDGCWIANGATYAPDGRQGAKELSVAGRKCVPAECRSFVFPGEGAYKVVWWHLWGDSLVDSSFTRGGVATMIREVRAWLANGGRMRDQLFIRVHGTMAVENLVETAPCITFLSELPLVFDARRR